MESIRTWRTRLPKKPIPLSFRVELGANPDARANAGFLRAANDHLQLVELLDDYDHALANLHAKEREVNETFVLEPAADQKSLRVCFQREGGVQLGFRAAFDAEVILASLAQKLFDDFAAGIDLHRKHAEVTAGIIELSRGVLKRPLNFL